MISIRRMTVEDIPASQNLLSQLGFRMEISEARGRFDAIARSDDQAVMVAADDGRIIALCHLFAHAPLGHPPEAVLQALVVDPAARGSGVGKRMMAAAEAWAAVFGCRSVTLGSDVSPPDAHAFYQSLGYRNEATSDQMRRPLGVTPQAQAISPTPGQTVG
jgi:GNAT superfamily N-acetyltransferase